jgi:hypothetical protein
VRSEGEDKLCWTPSHKGKFDVRSFYKVFACKEEDLFPGKSIWRTKVPLTVIDRCCMCKMIGASIHHILLHCEVARILLNAISAASVFLELCLSRW